MITADLPVGRYGAILVDPPWHFVTYDGKSAVPTQGADPYTTMTFADLVTLDVPSVAADDCALIMWHTGTHTDQALQLGKEWGFRFIRSELFVWVKAAEGKKPPIGPGYWSRNGAECCALFTRGSPKVMDHSVDQVIFCGRGDHSAKPEIVHRQIERLVKGPYLELFGRQTHKGWTVWGDQVGVRDGLFAP